VSDAVDAAEQDFGEARLLQAIQQGGSGDAQALVDAVKDAVRQHTGEAVQNDDITLMAIRYRGASADTAREAADV
jgi:sigma-B regulation protein RsbU (phosphoserine phosphatase)